MFRDLKEYQEIAKIYADKVSKPEDLEERVKGGGVPTNPVKPFEKPAPQVSGRRDNRPQMKGGITFKKPTPSVSNKRAEMSKRRREMQNNTNKEPEYKPEKGVVFGQRTNEVGAQGGGKPSSGDLSMFKDKKPEPKPLTNKQKFDAKFIKKDKGVGFVKRGTPGAQRAENIEKNKNRAKEMAKARLAAKKDGTASPQLSGKERAQQMAKDRLAKKAAMKEGALIPVIKPTMPLLRDKRTGEYMTTDGKPFDMEKFKKNSKTNKTDIKSSYEYDAYDLVLEYLLSTEQAATIEEANYVMTEMDAETIQGIVEEQKKTLTEKPGDGYIGPKFLNIKNPITNFINKKRNQKGGGNYRVDEVEKNAGVESGFAGEKIKF